MNFREKGICVGCKTPVTPIPMNPIPVNPQIFPGYVPKAPVQPIPHTIPIHPTPVSVPPTPVPPTPVPPTPVPVPAEGTLNLFPVDEGYINGTIYRGIYQPYRNYQPIMLMPTSEKARMMFDVDKHWFALHELRMYLDNFPDDREAINMYNVHKNEYIRAKEAYEAQFGAIGEDAESLNAVPFNWTVGTWPWDGGM